jgi:hypothetical protein
MPSLPSSSKWCSFTMPDLDSGILYTFNMVIPDKLLLKEIETFQGCRSFNALRISHKNITHKKSTRRKVYLHIIMRP